MILRAMRYSDSCLTVPKWDSRSSGTRRCTPRADVGESLPGRVCSSDVAVQANQWRRNSGRGPHLFKKAKLESATREVPNIGSNVCQGHGNRSNEIPWTWHQGQLKAQAEFLVSRNLTLSPTYVGGICHVDDCLLITMLGSASSLE